MQFNTIGLTMKPLLVEHAEALLQLRLDNREYMSRYDPIRPEHYWTIETQRELLANGQLQYEQGAGYTFGMFTNDTGQLIGRIELSGVSRGPFQNANIGYFVDTRHHRQGYATEAVRWCVQFAFREAGLHRLQAGVMTWNTPSSRVLEKAGFRREGLAERYLCINGNWEDHVLYAITSEEI